eukprot:351094-Chlamydomonas_euryale.AAC.4
MAVAGTVAAAAAAAAAATSPQPSPPRAPRAALLHLARPAAAAAAAASTAAALGLRTPLRQRLAHAINESARRLPVDRACDAQRRERAVRGAAAAQKAPSPRDRRLTWRLRLRRRLRRAASRGVWCGTERA